MAIQQEKAKIFLAAERGLIETDWFRTQATFAYESFQNEQKTPFGPLYVCNDETLAGKGCFRRVVREDTLMLLVPLVGAVRFTDNKRRDFLVTAGQCFSCHFEKESPVEISNPYEDDLVNFLQICIQADLAEHTQPALCSFNLDTKKNEQTVIAVAPTIVCSLGKFDGRKEATRCLANAQSSAFVFVIQGAFEVQNRLLETRDALALWNVDAVEFEALSNEAILLLLELPVAQTGQ